LIACVVRVLLGLCVDPQRPPEELEDPEQGRAGGAPARERERERKMKGIS